MVLFVVLLLGLLWLAWGSTRARAWRGTWSRWDWAGASVLTIGLVFFLSAGIGHASLSWRNTTGFYKERLLEHATWSVGALAIGVGILPVLVGGARRSCARRTSRAIRGRGPSSPPA